MDATDFGKLQGTNSNSKQKTGRNILPLSRDFPTSLNMGSLPDEGGVHANNESVGQADFLETNWIEGSVALRIDSHRS